MRMLIVDDDPVQTEKIVEAAKKAGFENITLANSYEAAEQLIESGEEFHVAVIDLILQARSPDFEEGKYVIKKLREAQRFCCITALTATLDNESGVRAMKAGADDFISIKWGSLVWDWLLAERLRLWRGVAEHTLNYVPTGRLPVSRAVLDSQTPA